MDEKFYTVPEVAELLKVSKNYIYDLIHQKKINYIRLSERRIRISESILEGLKLQNKDNLTYDKIVQPPKRGRKPNGAGEK
jgi:excisionase family DNA binding protein